MHITISSRTAAACYIQSTFWMRFLESPRNIRSCCNPGMILLVSIARVGIGMTPIPYARAGRFFRDNGRDGGISAYSSGTIATSKMMTIADFQHILSGKRSTRSVLLLGERAWRDWLRSKLTRQASSPDGRNCRRKGNGSVENSDTTAGKRLTTVESNSPTTSTQ
jgi:hypothetical protein